MEMSITPLDAQERARLLGLLDALAGYLGAPGDWGYGTRLGRFTVDVLALRHDVRQLGGEQDTPVEPYGEWRLTDAGDIEPMRAGGTD
jgi:hypothetical protein